MYFNKRNLWALIVFMLFLCIISFLLGVYTLKNGTLRKAYDILFAIENLDQKNLDFKSSEVNKIDTLVFLNSKKKQNKLIKILSDKYNSLKSIVSYRDQWTTERPWLKTKFQFNKEKEIKGRFKLIGMNPDHFREANNWSVRVKLNEDIYIYKYKKFNLLIPYSRGFFVDAFYNTLFEKIGGLTITSKPIITRIRDQYTLQLFEPFFSKELIENQGYRDGMIISEDSVDSKGKPHLKVVHPNGYDELSNDQKKIYQFYEKEFQKGQLKNYYDVKQYAFLAAVAINTGNSFHHFGGFNLNLYVNPISGHLMPFLREISFIPYSLPKSVPFENLKKNFFLQTKINKYNYNQFDEFSRYLDQFSYSINKVSVDSIISNNKNMSSIYHYANDYYSWSYAFKKRIRIPIIFKNKFNFRAFSIQKEHQQLISKTQFLNNVYYLRNSIFSQHDIVVNNATLIFSGNISRLGNQKIKIQGDSSSTIIFENAKVNLSNIEFIGFGNRIKVQNRAVTSAITFYVSEINLKNVIFRNNYSGDDLVNIFRSKFIFNNVIVQNSKYDGIDFDFSRGKVLYSHINNSGNDGLDFGGSSVILYKTIISRCGDKGISVGEKSSIQLCKSIIKNSEIGVGLKDESILRIRELSIENNHLDLAAYTKKGKFDASTLDIFPKEFARYKYLIEPGVLVKNNLQFKATDKAKNLLYGKKYGKASVR